MEMVTTITCHIFSLYLITSTTEQRQKSVNVEKTLNLLHDTGLPLGSWQLVSLERKYLLPWSTNVHANVHKSLPLDWFLYIITPCFHEMFVISPSHVDQGPPTEFITIPNWEINFLKTSSLCSKMCTTENNFLTDLQKFLLKHPLTFNMNIN